VSVQNLKKAIPRLEVPLSLTSGMYADSMTGLPGPHYVHQVTTMASKDPKMGKQGTVVKTKYEI